MNKELFIAILMLCSWGQTGWGEIPVCYHTCEEDGKGKAKGKERRDWARPHLLPFPLVPLGNTETERQRVALRVIIDCKGRYSVIPFTTERHVYNSATMGNSYWSHHRCCVRSSTVFECMCV